MFIKIFLNTNICLISVTTQEIQFVFDSVNEGVIAKMKYVHKGKRIDKFLGLKSKMYSMLSHDGKEPNTAKGANITTEFKEYKDTLINKKVIRHKIRRIQSKKHKIGTYQVNKISISNIIVLTIKDTS